MNGEHIGSSLRQYDAAVIGGGPAGSAAALFLRRSGFDVCVIEKKQFPRETVCGEFLSNEVSESLKELGLFDGFLNRRPNPMHALHLHTERGRTLEAELGFTAYGMKRGTFDHFLLSEAGKRGVCIIQPAEADAVVRTVHGFTVRYRDASGVHEFQAARVIAAYGRQNILDKRLGRHFAGTRSRLNGIKFHLDRSQCPGIAAHAIHLFTGSHLYCGVNAVNDGRVTVCALEERDSGDERPRMQLRHLARENAAFRKSFNAEFEQACETAPLYGTGNIYFGGKEAVCGGIFMTGDAADVIAPLTGDGMGMAFEGGRLLAEVFGAQRARSLDDRETELLYERRRTKLFQRRLSIARAFQHVLLTGPLRVLGLSLVGAVPPLLPYCVSLTRGRNARS